MLCTSFYSLVILNLKSLRVLVAMKIMRTSMVMTATSSIAAVWNCPLPRKLRTYMAVVRPTVHVDIHTLKFAGEF